MSPMNGAAIVFLCLMAAVNNATPFALEPGISLSSSLASSFAVKILSREDDRVVEVGPLYAERM